MSDPLCVICFMLIGRRACPAITSIAGDAICADHVKVRIDMVSLAGAIRVAQEDLAPRVGRPALAAPVHEVHQLVVMEPLSEREHDVLHYLATRLTTREIGAQLFISVNTVKTHAQAVYRKLGVTGGRRPAVARARQLGLL